MNTGTETLEIPAVTATAGSPMRTVFVDGPSVFPAERGGCPEWNADRVREVMAYTDACNERGNVYWSRLAILFPDHTVEEVDGRNGIVTAWHNWALPARQWPYPYHTRLSYPAEPGAGWMVYGRQPVHEQQSIDVRRLTVLVYTQEWFVLHSGYQRGLRTLVDGQLGIPAGVGNSGYDWGHLPELFAESADIVCLPMRPILPQHDIKQVYLLDRPNGSRTLRARAFKLLREGDFRP